MFVDHDNGRGFFKTYDNVGSAKVAFRHQNHMSWRQKPQYAGKILEMIDGEWFVLYDIPKNSDRLPWEKEVESYSYDRGYGRTEKNWRSVPMTRDEYGEFRARVERERLNLFIADEASAVRKESTLATS